MNNAARRKEPMSNLIRAHSEVVRRMELGAAGAVFIEIEPEASAPTTEDRLHTIRERVDRLLERECVQGATLYVRERDLPRLFPAWNLEALSDGEIVARLGMAVGASMNALASGHWTADRNRLAALQMALKSEMKGSEQC